MNPVSCATFLSPGLLRIIALNPALAIAESNHVSCRSYWLQEDGETVKVYFPSEAS